MPLAAELLSSVGSRGPLTGGLVVGSPPRSFKSDGRPWSVAVPAVIVLDVA